MTIGCDVFSVSSEGVDSESEIAGLFTFVLFPKINLNPTGFKK